jgi:hypothetical protein
MSNPAFMPLRRLAGWTAARAEAFVSASGDDDSRRNSGSVAIHLAFMMLVIMGFASLGIEVTFLLRMHRAMQMAADASALGAATAMATGYPSSPSVEALAAASAAGFTNGTASTKVTVDIPPADGPNTGNVNAVEVIVDQPQTLAIISLFGPATYDVGARAVAVAGSNGQYCIEALDPSASGAITLANNATVNNPNCGVAANSSSASALILNSNASINGPVSVHGGWSLGSNATLTNSDKTSSAPVIANPYASDSVQTPPSCTTQSASGGNNATIALNPGHFCSGWNFANNVTLNLAPGTYYIDQRFNVTSNAVINGNGGVTLVINGNYAINLSNNVQVNLTAPSTGPYAGLAFFGSTTATSTVTQEFSNNTTLTLTGSIYFPNQIVQFDNNAVIENTACTQIVARIVTVENNAALGNQCGGTGVKPIGQQPSALVE